MFLINGVAGHNIDVSDRGFQYGDGLFETVEINGGRLVFFDRHLRRLLDGCRCLRIPLENSDSLVDEATGLANGIDRGVLKIIVTRGKGGRGYRLPDVVTPTRVVSVHPYPDYPENYASHGIVARFCSARLGLNPSLAGIKHLNRLEQVLARAEWTDAGVQEGLMLDAEDHVIEGTMSNLFYVVDERLYTSYIHRSGVAGVMREIILELAASKGLQVSECFFGADTLLNADEVFVCNSVIGLWPVVKIDNQKFTIGPVTRQTSAWLGQYKNQWMHRC